MPNQPISARPGPGRLLVAISLGCFVFTIVGSLLAIALASEKFAAAGAAPSGSGLQFALSGVMVVANSILGAAVSSLLGIVFVISGVMLARNHPHGKILWPCLGLAVNAVVLLGAAVMFLYVFYLSGSTANGPLTQRERERAPIRLQQ